MQRTNRIKFGDGFDVTDEGDGVIRVDGGGGSGGTVGIDFETYPQAGAWLYVETTNKTGSPNTYGIELKSADNMRLLAGTNISAVASGTTLIQAATLTGVATTDMTLTSAAGATLRAANGDLFLYAQGSSKNIQACIDDGNSFLVRDTDTATIYSLTGNYGSTLNLLASGAFDIKNHLGTSIFKVQENGTITPAPALAAGSVGATELASTAVTPGSYGDGTHVGAFTVDADGRLTAASSVAITGGSGNVAADAIWDAKGDLAVGTGADTAAKLTVGLNGQVLTADSAQTTGTKWATPSGSGATKLYDFTISGADQNAIDTNVDGTTVANFAGYDVLEVWMICRTDEAGAAPNMTVIVNNDTSSIYDRQNSAGFATTNSAGTSLAAANWQFQAHGSGGSSGYAATTRMTFPGYAGTTFWKTAEVLNANSDATAGNNVVSALALGYRSTSAISRIKIAAAGAAKLKIGSRLIVYGR